MVTPGSDYQTQAVDYISQQNAGNNVNSFAIRVANGGGIDDSGFATLIGLGAESGGWSKCAIGHTRTGGYDVGDIIFLNRNTIDNADCTISDERMRIIRDGYVGIAKTSTWITLNLGNCAAVTDPFINFGKNTGTGSYRDCKMGYNSGFTFCIGPKQPNFIDLNIIY